MNLFELFAKVVLDISEYENEVSKVVKSGESLASKLKSGLATAGKVMAAGVGVATTAVGALSKSALDSYASYEQLTGGVETLFKQSAQTVKGYADIAYKTAGLSANEYMEMVTSFSASLLQGLGGDTAAAADVADQAIIDMSDNANKMGTSMSMIQNAYQGFAKQNYTMLDNLKLGYGGTQAEMARLINDSGVLGDTMEVTANTVNQVSFDKIIEAIHVIQNEMGITGTTAKEASTTIEGSVNSAKSAWTNLITGIADENANLDELVGNFVDSAVTAADNVLPRITQILSGLGKAIQKIAPVLSEQIPAIVMQILPALVDSAVSLFEAFVDVLPDVMSTIEDVLPEIAAILMEAIPSILPTLLEAVGVLITSLMAAVPQILISAFQASPIVATIASLIGGLQLASSLSGLIGSITGVASSLSGLSGAFSTVLGVVKGAAGAFSGLFSILLANPIALVIAAVAALVAGIIYLWNTNEGFRDAVIAIWEAIKNAFATAVEFIKALFDGFVEFFAGVWEGIQGVFAGAAEFFSGIFTAAWEAIQSVWSVAVEFFAGIWEGIQSIFSVVASVLGSFFAAAWSAVQTAWSVAVSFFQSVWDGIQAVFSVVAEVLGGFFSAAWEAVEAIWSLAVAFFTEVWNGIQTVFSVVAEVLGGFFSAAWDAVQAVWGTAVDFFTEIWNGIQAVFFVVEQVIGGFFSAAWAAIESVWGLAVSFFQAIWDGIVNIFSGVADWFGDIFTQAWEAIKSAWDGVTDFFSGIWEGIIDVFSDTVSTFFDIGADIVRGLWDGIQSLADWLWNNVSGWVSDIWNGIKDFFDINSPSKKMSWIAKMLIYGMSDEIDKNGDIAVKSAESWSKDLEDAISLSPPDFPVGPYPGGTGYQTGNPWGKQGGDTYVTINSPVAVDAVQAAREWRKTAQRMAMSL